MHRKRLPALFEDQWAFLLVSESRSAFFCRLFSREFIGGQVYSRYSSLGQSLPK